MGLKRPWPSPNFLFEREKWVLNKSSGGKCCDEWQWGLIWDFPSGKEELVSLHWDHLFPVDPSSPRRIQFRLQVLRGWLCLPLTTNNKRKWARGDRGAHRNNTGSGDEGPASCGWWKKWREGPIQEHQGGRIGLLGPPSFPYPISLLFLSALVRPLAHDPDQATYSITWIGFIACTGVWT